jgi:hypothetical protein
MIIKTPTVTIDWGAGAVDYSDHVISAMVASPASAVDDRTFGAPYATDSVVGAESITLHCKWSDALMAALDSVVETEGDLVLTPVASGGTITATVKFTKVPMADFQIGNRVECDLVLAVVDAIDWTAAV